MTEETSPMSRLLRCPTLLFAERKYVFKVRAVNAMGYGEFSEDVQFTVRARLRSAMPVPTRGELTNRKYQFNDAEVHIKWQAPVDNGGSPVTNYGLYVDDGQVVLTRTLYAVRWSNNSFRWTNRPRERLPCRSTSASSAVFTFNATSVCFRTQTIWLVRSRPCWSQKRSQSTLRQS